MVDIPHFNIFGALTPNQVWIVFGIVVVIGIIALIVVIRRLRRPDPNEPISTIDEFEKSGYIQIHEVLREAEGASFLWFERANGDIENRCIGQPFTFYMEDDSVERHHINARGSYRCINPKTLFADYKPSLKDLNLIPAFTEQHQRQLRTGTMANEKLSRHLRTFFMIFLMAGFGGLAIAAATVRHG